jgi:hypothetical protein
MRGFNPIPVWTNVPLATKTASVIKSIQRGTITIADASTTNTATISSVSTSKSLVLFGGFSTTYASSDNVSRVAGRVELTDSTTVTATRASSSGGSMVVAYQVVEFY